MKASKKQKKRAREQQLERDKTEFMDWAQEIIDDADDFLETATPFEISRTLTVIGVSTSHRSGIEEILNRATHELLESGVSPQEMIQQFLTRVVNQWKSELRDKNKSTDMEDMIFLFQAAQHFTLQWVKIKMRDSEDAALKAPGLSHPKLEDFFPFKKPSSA